VTADIFNGQPHPAFIFT